MICRIRNVERNQLSMMSFVSPNQFDYYYQNFYFLKNNLEPCKIQNGSRILSVVEIPEKNESIFQ